jgi:FecR-like protein
MLMNFSINSLIQYTLIILLFIGAQVVQANTGKAFSIKGTANVNGDRLTLSSEVKEGDIITTDKNSSVKIIMEDKTVLDIQENTRFKISKYQYKETSPETGSSSFEILKGTFRYISGLIAKKRSQNVSITAGTATIGIRGSFDTITFDGTTIAVDTSIGTAVITFASGQTLTITAGNTGSFNFSSGQSSVTPTSTPDPIAQAASDIASNPTNADNVDTALDNLGDADSVMVIAALINNASQLGVTNTNTLASALSNAVKSNSNLAVGLAYVASALSPANAQTFANAIKTAAPDQADAIQDASTQGKSFAPAPKTTSNGDPVFPLRVDTGDDNGQDGTGTGTDSGTSGVGGGGGGGGGSSSSPS